VSWRAIIINKEIYSKPIEPEAVGGLGEIKINLFLPPTDIPKSVYVELDKKADAFRIKFQYSLEEKGRVLFSNDQASFSIGEQTGKPLLIEIKRIVLDKINKISLTNFIKKDLENFISSSLGEIHDLRKRANVNRVKEFLTQQAPELAGAMA